MQQMREKKDRRGEVMRKAIKRAMDAYYEWRGQRIINRIAAAMGAEGSTR